MSVPIAREGWPFVAIPGAIALGLAALGHRRLALPFAAAAAAAAGPYSWDAVAAQTLALYDELLGGGP